MGIPGPAAEEQWRYMAIGKKMAMEMDKRDSPLRFEYPTLGGLEGALEGVREAWGARKEGSKQEITYGAMMDVGKVRGEHEEYKRKMQGGLARTEFELNKMCSEMVGVRAACKTANSEVKRLQETWADRLRAALRATEEGVRETNRWKAEWQKEREARIALANTVREVQEAEEAARLRIARELRQHQQELSAPLPAGAPRMAASGSRR